MLIREARRGNESRVSEGFCVAQSVAVPLPLSNTREKKEPPRSRLFQQQQQVKDETRCLKLAAAGAKPGAK